MLSVPQKVSAMPLPNDPVDVARMAETLRTTPIELAQAAGLRGMSDPDVRERLPDLAAILTRLEPRFGSLPAAYAWCLTEPLPGFDGRTAMVLLREGRSTAVFAYLEAVEAGIHA